ncbi:hypothetical protein STVA_24590 [Allostella vacuolata]|nr:hypothetical protein STVA_24590 [Stella vacuolata]
MRIDRMSVRNFKGFRQSEFLFHPEFNLIVGVNGTGKTSVLDALSVALGGWFLGLPGFDSRPIAQAEVYLAGNLPEPGRSVAGQRPDISWEAQYPCEVEADGRVLDMPLSWSRALNGASGRTTHGGARAIRELAAGADALVRAGKPIVLPLLSYYGTGRLWRVPREQAQVRSEEALTDKASLSRLAGYRNSVDPRLAVSDLVRWIARQAWVTFQQSGTEPPALGIVRRAILGCVERASGLYFDARIGELVVEFEDGRRQPFNNLSDGQRSMLALVGDVALKAATLNPQLDAEAIARTPGIVLIDELDLHLHPRWQRQLIEQLRTTFPCIQFICTTHSPFLIQSLRSGQELIVLDGQPTAKVSDMSIDEIAKGIMGIPDPTVSERYMEMKGVAHDYLETLEEAATQPAEALEGYKRRLARSIAPFADNPAFQAFLEMKRVAKIGE